jgi:S1-C subfamily serine protease
MKPISDPSRADRYIRVFFFFMILAGAILFLLPHLKTSWMQIHSEPRVVTARGELAASEKSAIEIFHHSSPSVVYITTLTETINLWTRDITRIPSGTGSGFIWNKDGHIITNYHVLQEASAVRIRLSDQRTFDAKLVGASPDHDIAVLRIETFAGLPSPLPIGTSGDLQVGQMTYAIGNPFGLDHTLTTGVVSALERTLYNDNGSQIKGLIQTDAAINPGNSGGPLLDSAGRLIGINTAIFSPSGAYAGIGFAVPVDTVNRIVPQLIAKGEYRRPRLGITIDGELNRIITKKLGVEGVAVIDVQKGSPAHRAGLQGATLLNRSSITAGDLIVAINQTAVKDIDTLLATLEDYKKGEEVTLKFYRKGTLKSEKIMLF